MLTQEVIEASVDLVSTMTIKALERNQEFAAIAIGRKGAEVCKEQKLQ